MWSLSQPDGHDAPRLIHEAVPGKAAVVEDQNSPGTGRYSSGYLGQAQRHAFGVAAREYQCRSLALGGADGTIDVCRRGAYWSLGADGRVPRLAHRRVMPFFWPTRASSCHHSSMGAAQGSAARTSANWAGKFF